MSSSTLVAVPPRVWIGCLACYNAGRLVGDWYDAEDAGEVIPEDLHGHPTSHEELWVFDLEGFPRETGEISPTAVVSWGELFEEGGGGAMGRRHPCLGGNRLSCRGCRRAALRLRLRGSLLRLVGLGAGLRRTPRRRAGHLG